VGSLYQQLLALHPPIAGNAFNDAESGSTVASTYDQAGSAISQGSAIGERAEFVTIETGTNDVCKATVDQMTSVSDFSAALGATPTRLTTGLPGMRVFVTSIPDFVGFWGRNSSNAAALAAWAATEPVYGECPDVFGSAATDSSRAAVAARTADLNAQIQSICASFEGCTYDGGAMNGLWSTLTPTDMAFDFFHLSLQGEAKLAAATWAATPLSSRHP
jgi:hypothetical protein